MSKDSKYRKLINCTRWRRLRADQLSRSPFCEVCLEHGIYTTATEVHHRKPVERGRDECEMKSLCYDAGNLMSLCHDCHRALHDRTGYHSRKYINQSNENKKKRFVNKYFGE